MSETNPPDHSDTAPITDEELYQTLDSKLSSWDFREHTPIENVDFGYNIVSLVSDNFPFLNHAGSEEFSAEELPGTLHPLFSQIYSPGGKSEVVYMPNMTVRRVKRREEHTEIEPHIPGFDEMMKSGMTFDEIIETLRSDPDIVNKIVPGETIIDNAIIIILAQGYKSSGLELIVKPDHISLCVYGNVGETRDLSEFLAHYHNNPSELSRISASLAVLAAKYCLRPQHYGTAEIMLTQSDKKFLSGFTKPE